MSRDIARRIARLEETLRRPPERFAPVRRPPPCSLGTLQSRAERLLRRVLTLVQEIERAKAERPT